MQLKKSSNVIKYEVCNMFFFFVEVNQANKRLLTKYNINVLLKCLQMYQVKN